MKIEKSIVPKMILILMVGVQSTFAASVENIGFSEKQFEFRDSKNGTHSFTPAGQEDLSTWQEMISFIYADYVKVTSDLQALANNLLESYSSKGKVMKAVAGPDTSNPEWFIIASVISGSDAAEAIMTKVSIENSVGVVMVYSRRFYGNDKGSELVSWFQANGRRLEANLISFQNTPLKSNF